MTPRAPMLMFPNTRRRHLARKQSRGDAIREPRAAKSFRAAGDRIVRQESALPSVVSRLLTPSIVARREIASEADEWSIRLATLAALGQYDALTFLVDGAARRAGYNVVDDPLADDAIRAAVEETRRSGATARLNCLPRGRGRTSASSRWTRPSTMRSRRRSTSSASFGSDTARFVRGSPQRRGSSSWCRLPIAREASAPSCLAARSGATRR